MHVANLTPCAWLARNFARACRNYAGRLWLSEVQRPRICDHLHDANGHAVKHFGR